MKTRTRRWIVALMFVSVSIASVSISAIRWRIQVVGMKAAGMVPELSWSEMVRFLRPRGPLQSSVVKIKNPYAVVLAPEATPARIVAGRELFRAQCAQCHGANARGESGPNLTEAGLRHGSSDLALYQTITRGIPGTPMLKRDLTSESAWDIVVFLKDTIAANSAARDDVSNKTSSRRAPPSGFHVTFEQLKAAADDPAEWLIYSGTYDGHRHSRLSQITPGNVSRLRIKWLFQFPNSARVVENTPLVVGNTMFISSPPSDVWALDTRSGEKLWSYSSPTPSEVKNTTFVNRGLAISGNTLYLGTLNAHLVALNAQTGMPLWDVKVAENNDGYGITSAPLALRDQVVVGVAGGDGGIRGFLDAYSPTTGKRIWRFYTVPGPGEPGHETWGGGASWKKGSAPTWLTGSYDPQLDLVYWGVGNPGPDYQGDVRPGANLYSNSVIALEAATGRLRWYYQFTPHDEHDWDAAQIPILADAMFDSQPRKLMYWANRNGFYYVLDRTTGQFLRAKAFVKQTWAAGFDSAGVPIQRPEGHPTREGALIFPNVHGGTNWWSPSYDPASNTIYVPTMEGADIYIRGLAIALPDGGYLGGVVGAQDPEVGGQPTWTAVRALDASTGQLRWEYRFPPRHPSIVMGGLLSTDGGLVFGGDEALFVGLDAREGRELWCFNVGNDIAAAPITYLVDGRQYITVAAGMTIMTFALD